MSEGTFPGTRLSIFQNLYSGETATSLAETSIGYGGSVTVFNRKASFLVPFFSLKAAYVAGEQDFEDGSTVVESNFTFYSAATDIGLMLFPIQRRRQGINVYALGLGSVGYNFISLDKDTTISNIPRSDQAFSFAYGTGIGAEWILAKGSNQWTISGEFVFKVENAVLLEEEFDLSSMAFLIGIGW